MNLSGGKRKTKQKNTPSQCVKIEVNDEGILSNVVAADQRVDTCFARMCSQHKVHRDEKYFFFKTQLTEV